MISISVTRALLFILVACLCSPLAHAGPAEDAEAAFSRFFPAMAARNQAEVAAMFAPDAQFYGTVSPELVTTPEGILEYFAVGLGGPGSPRGTPLQLTSTALSDDVVLIAGMWTFDRTLDGETTVGKLLRITAVLEKRDDRWLVVQFHNSPRPAPAP